MDKGMLVLMPVISRLSHQKLRWHSWPKLSAWKTQILMPCAELQNWKNNALNGSEKH